MSELPAFLAPLPPRPALPVPTRERWQPLRLGLVELFLYDSEEFWFRDGHLLLRGNNGTGKSKVLSLTLPFLLDAQLKPSRLEPDGDGAKRMAWNLLMGSYDRRVGYAWLEFGRLDHGAPRYLTLGAGLSASAARPQVDAWFFIIDDKSDAPRINQDLWLTNEQRVVLTKERLRDMLSGNGHVFDTAAGYRRAVDERLFRLGGQRYDALMDTLIQLRQPQLSKRPDETVLSDALTEALQPLPTELLGDVAEALGQLEEDRRQLDEHQALAKAVDRFDQRYRVYAGTQSRRQGRTLRQAQTEFDYASRARIASQEVLERAQELERQAQESLAGADVALARARARLDTLRADPTMQDANRLEAAEKDTVARERAAQAANLAVGEAQRRLVRAAAETAAATARATETERRLAEIRRECQQLAEAAGVAADHAGSPLAELDPAALAALAPAALASAAQALRASVAMRREQIAALRRRHAEASAADELFSRLRHIRDERQDAADAAVARRTGADADVAREGRSLVDAWSDHFISLRQLHVAADDIAAVLAALETWILKLSGDNPARKVLAAAHLRTGQRLADRRAALAARAQTLETERTALDDERRRLTAGGDRAPPTPYTRAADARDAKSGTPLWQLVDFRDAASAAQRAGLEAALEAAGLLDAWVDSGGELRSPDRRVLLHDTRLVERRPVAASLAQWLRVDMPAGAPMAAENVERLLQGVACAPDDPGDCEAWIAPDGRFRLGALAGAWTKPAAAYIGYTARAAARARRIDELAARLAELDAELRALASATAELDRDHARSDEEWRLAPGDEALRNAHLAAAASARETQLAREQLAIADARCRESELALRTARERVDADAADLRLPALPSALVAVETALDGYRDAQAGLAGAVRELHVVVPALTRRREDEEELRADLSVRTHANAAARIESEEAGERLRVLQEAVGARVEELQRQLTAARLAVETAEGAIRREEKALRTAGEARAVAQVEVSNAETGFRQRGEARAEAVVRLQKFAASGMLAAALPDIQIPPLDVPWTIDPALSLARRAEQALASLKDDDEAWARVQRQITEELAELQRSLSALGHQAPAETNDWGLVVRIIYQNRPEPPASLAARLAAEIQQRAELLTSREREILENHLQAEIASEIQRLLQAAERQVADINRELHTRPTSTGVRFRLRWQPLDPEDGAPVGLEAARKRLLNTGADLWTTEDRAIVGRMLHERIATERERADAQGGGTLLDQLGRALDYRRWHRFRVERWQDGHWRKLSGPASSGERALGLTVPLFAAVASFYTRSDYALSPRLMLLDEAFAGIDDAARAHCMGLIREFDLDFVITSEHEWACYAELPGVSICQLQRREGIDAVFVSRWSWDGKARLRDSDPDRRFAPA